MATDSWLLRTFLGRPDPYTPLDLPHTEMEPDPSVPNDPLARPSLDEALRAGVPPAGTYPASRCLKAVINEEWQHRRYAERDLAVVQARLSATAA
jgi:hypothetical protein